MPGRLTAARSIAGNTAVLTAAQVVGIATRMVYIVLVARLLGPELYALLAYSQAWYLAFMPLALLGLGPAIVHAIARDPDHAADVAGRALAIRLTMTGIAVLACVVLAWSIAPDPRAPLLITTLAAALAGRAVVAFAQHLYAAYEVNHHALRQEVAARVLELGLAAGVLLAGGSLLLLVATQGVVWWLQAARSLYVVRHELVVPRLDWQWSRWKPLLALALPLFVTAAAVDWRVNGPLILFRNLNDDAVLFGQFALAMQALFIANTIPQSLSTAAQPVLTRSAVRGDAKDLLYASVIQRLAFVVGAAAGLLGLALGPWLFGAVLGPGFVAAGELAGLTLWCLIPLLAGIAFPAVFVARGALRFQMVASVLGAVATTVLVVLLVPPFGARGAIIGAAAGFTLPPLLIYGAALRSGWTTLAGTVLRPAAAVAAALAVWLLMPSLLPAAGTAGALLLALAVLFGLALLLGVVTPAEQSFLREIWRARRGPETA
ncbi:MAG: lipopolysaccharide biosynthesis protein [Gammaproteobacteria bacterium]